MEFAFIYSEEIKKEGEFEMKRITAAVLSLVMALCLAGCGQSGEGNLSSTATGSVSGSSEPGTLKETYTPEYAQGFTIEYYNGGAKIIATKFSSTSEEGQTNERTQRILLLPEGAAKPVDAKWDKQIDGKVERVVTLASSHAGHFANLDAVGTIVGTSLSASSCEIPELKQAIEDGTVASLSSQKAEDGSKYFDQEVVAALNPQVIFVGGMQADVTVAKKLEESGMTCVYIGDFAEKDYKGRAQWIELFGAFIDKEKEGNAFLEDGITRANAVIDRAKEIENKPKVLWFNTSKAPWSVKTDKDYTASFIKDLGGEVLCPETEDNAIYVQSEEFLTYLQQADKLLYGNSLKYIKFETADDITCLNMEGQIDFSTAPAYKNGDCYVVSYDWAQDTANIGEIMESVAKMLYPEEFTDLSGADKIVEFNKTNQK